MIFIIGGLVILFVFFISIYNGLKRAEVAVENAKSGIDVALKRRYDLIPNLVEVVKGYASHEKALFEGLALMRRGALTPQEQYAASGQAINRLLAVAESYPELRASDHFLHLQRALMDVEEHIQASRRLYNRNLAILKTKVMTFPGNVVNGVARVKVDAYFEIPDDQRSAVRIDLKS